VNLFAVTFFALAALLAADHKHPGQAASAPFVIDEHNAGDYENLFPDAVFRRLKLGEYRFTVVPVDPTRFRANYTDRFWKASKANAEKYAIDPETGGLKEVATNAIPHQVFGLPFPEIDPNDPLAGSKIVHNYQVRSFQSDGSIHTFDLTDVKFDGDLIRRVKIFLSQRYYFGTTSAPPEVLPDNTAWRQLAAALEPKDVEGVGVLTWRFHDWTTWDHVWAYMPNVRRVRRVRTSTRGDRIPGFEVQGDDADCYDGKVTYFRWRLARVGEVIGPLGTDTPYAYELKPEPPTRWFMEFPYNNAVYETPAAKGAGWMTLRNAFVRRPVWIVEGTPRDPYYPVGKVLLYVDRDLYHAYYKIGFTPAGEQYQTNFCGQAWGRTQDGTFGGPSALLMIGVNEKENRGTPTGRFTRETFERGFSEDWFTPEHLSKLGFTEAKE
jgi:hypothetical protein